MSARSKTKQTMKSVEDTAEITAEVLVETIDQTVDAAKEQVEKASAAAVAGYDDFAAFQKNSMEAFVASGAILAKGLEALGREYFAFAEEAVEVNSKTAKALLTAKSLKEVVELQSGFARNAFDKSLSESGKLSEMSVRIATDAIEPVQKQFTVAVEAALKPLAA